MFNISQSVHWRPEDGLSIKRGSGHDQIQFGNSGLDKTEWGFPWFTETIEFVGVAASFLSTNLGTMGRKKLRTPRDSNAPMLQAAQP